MKIAYLVFAYRNPKLLERTISRLNSANCAFFIHIDRKSDLGQFSAIRGDNIFFLEQRLPVYWAEFSGVEAVLLLIREALAKPDAYDYFVLLSGSEYPLRRRHYIEAFLEANAGTEYMSIVKMPNLDAGKPIERVNTLRLPSSKPVRRFLVRGLAKFGLAQRDYRKHLGSFEPYAGHTWWALSRAACQHVLETAQRHPELARYFRNTFAPEEMFFHTILGNSPFRARMRRNLVYEDWSGDGGHPVPINERHLALFGAAESVTLNDAYGEGEVVFARKFSDDSLALADQVDQLIARGERA